MSEYEEKFAEFIRMCDGTKKSGADAVIIYHPEVLGDNYEEMVESLNRLSDAELKLLILPRSLRQS